MTDNKKPTPAELVRSMSTGKPEEIVAAAKKAGITITPLYVTKVRALDKARATKAKGRGKPKAAKKIAPAAAKPAAVKGGRPLSSGTPSDFVRSMPNATPAEIMAAAKAKGLSFSRGLIYMVRTKAGPKKGKAARAPKAAKAAPASAARKVAAPAKAQGKGGGSGKPNKSDFIRSMPNASAAEIVAAAKAKGFSFDVKYVSTIRSNERAAAKKRRAAGQGGAPVAAKRGPGRPRGPAAAAPVAKRGPGRPRKVPAARPATGGTDERSLRAAVSAYVVEHGLAAARRVVEEVGAKFRMIS